VSCPPQLFYFFFPVDPLLRLILCPFLCSNLSLRFSFPTHPFFLGFLSKGARLSLRFPCKNIFFFLFPPPIPCKLISFISLREEGYGSRRSLFPRVFFSNPWVLKRTVPLSFGPSPPKVPRLMPLISPSNPSP